MNAVMPIFAPIPSSVPSIVPSPAFFRSTKHWPISPAFRFRPSQSFPSRRTAPPIPVPTQIATTSRSPFAAPRRASPSAATRTSFSSRFGIARERRLERRRDLPPLDAEVHRPKERRPSLVERPGEAEADGGDVLPPGPGLRERRVRGGDERLGHLRRPAAEGALDLPPPADLPLLVDDARQDLRPPNVDSEDQVLPVGHETLLCG